jgi:hypothetical protein
VATFRNELMFAAELKEKIGDLACQRDCPAARVSGGIDKVALRVGVVLPGAGKAAE